MQVISFIKSLSLSLESSLCRSYSSTDIKKACDGADLAIACLGTGGMIIIIEKFNTSMHAWIHAGNTLEHEGHDRSDLNLPGNQLQLLQDVANTATSG